MFGSYGIGEYVGVIRIWKNWSLFRGIVRKVVNYCWGMDWVIF